MDRKKVGRECREENKSIILRILPTDNAVIKGPGILGTEFHSNCK